MKQNDLEVPITLVLNRMDGVSESFSTSTVEDRQQGLPPTEYPVVNPQQEFPPAELCFQNPQQDPTRTPVNHVRTSKDEHQTLKLYKKRYWVLFLYCAGTFLNGLMAFQYSVVTNISVCYYGVSVYTVDWSTMNLYVVCVVLMIPGTKFMDKFGLRISVVTASFLTTFGTVLQCFSLSPSGFSIAMASQVFASMGGFFYLSLPPKLATSWFGPKEVSRATAAIVIADNFGVALGFIFTPLMIPQDCHDIDAVYHGKSLVAYLLTGGNVALFIFILGTFQEKPPIPPSLSQVAKISDAVQSYRESFVQIVKNINFLLLVLCRGVMVATFYSLSTILNSLILSKFPEAGDDVGWMGLLFVCSGLLGSFSVGAILDHTHKFKETSVAICGLSFLFMLCLTGTFYSGRIWLVFIIIALLGFLLVSYHVSAFELAVEITYPRPEQIAGSLLVSTTMALSIPINVLSSYLLQTNGYLAPTFLFSGVLLLALLCSVIIKPEFHRTMKNETCWKKPVANV